MSIDHGKVLAEIEHEITAMATKVDVTVRLGRASNIMAKVRALAQPAEAVEGDAYEVREDGKRVRKDRWETGFRSIVSALVGPRVEFEISDIVEEVRRLANKADDAAQGAVAYRWVRNGEPVGRWIDGKPSPNEFEAAEHCKQLAEWTVEYAYTHPQAAPAQGDGWKLVPVEPTEQMLHAGVKVWDTSGADPEQLECARDTYRTMLAAAPSPEPRS